MSLNFAIFVLYQIVSTVSDLEFTNITVTLLFRSEFLLKIEDLMKNPVLDPKEYNFVWNKLTKQNYSFSLVRYQ